jgi:hypothetical protein
MRHNPVAARHSQRDFRLLSMISRKLSAAQAIQTRRGPDTPMLFTPLRKALIAGAGLFAVGVGAGVTVHSATAGTTLTAATATPSPSAAPGSGGNVCRPAKVLRLGAARQVLSIAASVTGQTEQQITDQLRAGKTLNQVAGSKASTVETQALAKLKTALDGRVSSGKLSAAQEQTMLDKAKTELDKAMASDLSGKLPPAGTAAGCTPGGLVGTLIKVTADKTGLTVQQVMDQLRAGKSIDQIAGSKAAEIKATVLQMQQQKDSSALDNLMGRSGLQGPGKGFRFGALGHGRGHGPNGPQRSPSPTPSA